MEHKHNLEELFARYIDNKCTEEEVRFLLENLQSEESKILLEDLIDAQIKEAVPEKMVNRPEVQQRLADAREIIHARTLKKRPVKFPMWRKMLAAAVIILCSGIAVYFYTLKEPVLRQNTNTAEILQGGNKATLTLSDGSVVSLTDQVNGRISDQPGISIKKTADGEVVYEIQDALKDDRLLRDKTSYNTLATPRGGKFSVVLPEGTKIWLNAATSVSYPADFKERTVILVGEAYFEVSKNKDKPFRVITGNQTVEVLGTHFNVSSYPDESSIKTTLLEGSVRVKGKTEAILRPGEQSRTNRDADRFSIVSLDPEGEIAWKNNLFFFENEPIKEIMLQISRWYDVDVVYKDDVSDKKVWGSITRFSEISKVLEILELTGKIHFKVEGRRVIVMK